MINHVPGAPGHDVWITCDDCGAIWLGQPFDICEWCNAIGAAIDDTERQGLMFPEWMGWGDRFDSLSPINQIVWAATRGYHGDYVGAWQRRIGIAVRDGLVTDVQAATALQRAASWQLTHMRQSES